METAPDISTLPMPTLNAVVAVAIAVGTLYCFLGYRTMKFVLALTGFVLAGAVAGALGAWVSQGQAIAALAAAALGGIAGGMALLFLYRTGIFFMGLVAAALVAQALLSDRGEPWVMWAVIGAGAAGGLLALVLERPAMTCATAALGAWMVVCGVAFFVVGDEFLEIFQRPVDLGEHRIIILGSWGVLTLGGVLAQFATYKKPKREVVVKEVKAE
jgi:Domain of unknown function (DUF4203)